MNDKYSKALTKYYEELSELDERITSDSCGVYIGSFTTCLTMGVTDDGMKLKIDTVNVRRMPTKISREMKKELIAELKHAIKTVESLDEVETEDETMVDVLKRFTNERELNFIKDHGVIKAGRLTLEDVNDLEILTEVFNIFNNILSRISNESSREQYFLQHLNSYALFRLINKLFDDAVEGLSLK